MDRWAAFVFGAVAWGCGSASTSGPVAGEATATAPVASAPVTASASATSDVPPAEAPTAAAASPFVAVMEGTDCVYPGNGTIVACTSSRVTEDQADLFRTRDTWYVLRDRAFVEIGAYQESLYYGFRVSAVYMPPNDPASLILLGTNPDNRTSYPKAVAIGKGSTTFKKRSDGDFVGFAKRGDSVFGMTANGWASTLVQLSGSAPALKPQPKPADAADSSACWGNRDRLSATSFGSNDEGDVLAGGFYCEGKEGHLPGVEIWRRGSNTSEIVPLKEKHELSISSGGAFIVGPTLQKWDGSKFVAVEPPPPKPAVQAFETAAGRVFAVGIASEDPKAERPFVLWERKDKAWQTAPLPDGYTLEGVLYDGKRVWAKGTSKDKVVLFELAEPGQPKPASIAALPPSVTLAKEPPLGMPGPNCESNIVVLYGFTKVTPDDYTFPLTRKALKGHTELQGKVWFSVTKHYGKKYFTASTTDYKTALKVVDIVKKGVQGSAPAIVCTQPFRVRDVDIDLASGEIRAQ